MIQNYIKTALRFIARNKLFSIINILGLSIGMACSILIFLWVNDELSYDRFHCNADDIYRVILQKETDGIKENIARTPIPVGRALKDEFPEIVECTRFYFTDFGFYNDVDIFKEEGACADKDIFSMFDLNLINGDTSTIFASNFNIIISKKLALKIFDSIDVLGKDLRISEKTTFTITGVYEDLPHNSHLKFDFILPYDLLFEFGLEREMWDNYNNTHYTYVQLDKTANVVGLNSKIKDLFKKHNARIEASIFLQPFNDIYLKSDFSGDYSGLGNSKNIFIFSIISIFILIIAGFNFMNLTTAQASSRLKEIGIRKVLGGQRKSLVFQFLGEALFMTFIAHILAIILVELVIPVFNTLTNKELAINYFSSDFLLGVVIIVVLVGMFSGSYPSVFLSRLNPLSIFKGGISGTSGGGLLRKILVIFQFSISIILIIGALIVMKQINFISNKDLGFNKEQLIYFSLQGNGRKYELLKERLLNYPEISDVTVLSHELTDVVHMTRVTWEGKNDEDVVPMNIMFVDHDFIPTMQMELIKGKDFKRVVEGDSMVSYIVNETAVKLLGFTDPIGKRFSTGRLKGYITGVVKDFNFQPLYNEIQPMVLTSYPGERFYLYVRIKSNQIEDIISTIKSEFENFAPNDPFDYFFIGESINNMYKNESYLAKLTRYFTFITIFISSLGLFGLVSFMAERRTKEIGIRKALGASVSRIVFVLSKEIIIWVIIANVISWPIAYFAANKWLVNFSYRIELDIWVFIASGFIALIIAFLTISLRALKTARINPVNALRYE